MTKHQKHAKLTLRENHNFAPNEITILGTKCSVISNLIQQITTLLPTYKMAYFDASHSKDVHISKLENYTFHHQGSVAITTNIELNKFNQRILFSQYDCVFINGNHYKGDNQILILDKEKEASVLKRISQLTNVKFIVEVTKDTPLFNFLTEEYPQLKNLKKYHISDVEQIAAHINTLISEKIPSIKGLVLAGGKSTRMGTDKGMLNFYGKNQRDVAVELLEQHQLETFLSVRKNQEINYKNKIDDTFLELGPFGAICSAFQKNPNVAWLVLATDLPFVNSKIIEQLLQQRNPSKIATTIKGKGKKFPEPLITIWEPKSYSILLNYLAQGYSCPRKVLINSDVEMVEVDDQFIRNVNTPEDFKNAYKEINEKNTSHT